MSVVEKNIIDGIALANKNSLILLISDHLDWNNEYEHLLILQDKINAYVSFIENKEYTEMFPQKNIKQILFEIHEKHGVTENARKFVDEVNRQLARINVFVFFEKEESNGN